jgi:hypothetical protein
LPARGVNTRRSVTRLPTALVAVPSFARGHQNTRTLLSRVSLTV